MQATGLRQPLQRKSPPCKEESRCKRLVVLGGVWGSSPVLAALRAGAGRVVLVEANFGPAEERSAKSGGIVTDLLWHPQDRVFVRRSRGVPRGSRARGRRLASVRARHAEFGRTRGSCPLQAAGGRLPIADRHLPRAGRSPESAGRGRHRSWRALASAWSRGAALATQRDCAPPGLDAAARRPIAPRCWERSHRASSAPAATRASAGCVARRSENVRQKSRLERKRTAAFRARALRSVATSPASASYPR